MGALLAHAAMGAVWGLVGVALAGRTERDLPRADAALILLVCIGAALLGDLDAWFGAHRVTTHNLWLLGVAPALLATLALGWDALRAHPLRHTLHVLPAATLSELWLDVFGPSLAGAAALLWPFVGTSFAANKQILGTPDVPVWDASSALVLGALWSLAVALVHARMAASLQEAPGASSSLLLVAAGVGHALVVVLPWLVLMVAGVLVPV